MPAPAKKRSASSFTLAAPDTIMRTLPPSEARIFLATISPKKFEPGQ